MAFLVCLLSQKTKGKCLSHCKLFLTENKTLNEISILKKNEVFQFIPSLLNPFFI